MCCFGCVATVQFLHVLRKQAAFGGFTVSSTLETFMPSRQRSRTSMKMTGTSPVKPRASCTAPTSAKGQEVSSLRREKRVNGCKPRSVFLPRSMQINRDQFKSSPLRLFVAQAICKCASRCKTPRTQSKQCEGENPDDTLQT